MGNNNRLEKIKNRVIGNKYKTVYGEEYEIIEYHNAYNVTVKFECGYISYNNQFGSVKRGNVKNLMRKGEYGQYIGEGKYRSRENNKKTLLYLRWENMFARCYNKKELIKNPTYKECIVCESWFNFQNFAKWYEEQIWTDESILSPDKDILNKGNKIYSPETVLLVDQRINTLFIKADSTRNHAIGTYLNKQGKYTAQCNTGNNTNRNLGSYDTEIEAFYVYKNAKENYIKQVADEYKQKYPQFPQKLYDAMYNWEVEITD